MSISSILSNDKQTLIYPNISAVNALSLGSSGIITNTTINANSTTVPALTITNSSGLALQLVAGGECRNVITYVDSTINLEGNEDIIYIDVEGATVSLPSATSCKARPLELVICIAGIVVEFAFVYISKLSIVPVIVKLLVIKVAEDISVAAIFG